MLAVQNVERSMQPAPAACPPPRKRLKVTVDAEAQGAGAFVVHFPSGPDPAQHADVSFEVFQGTGHKAWHRVVIARGKDVDYIARNFGRHDDSSRGRDAEPCRYALGVFDPSTGAITVTPVETGRVLRMGARVHGEDYLDFHDVEADVRTADESKEARQAAYRELTSAFGNKRSKRAAEKRERAQVDTNAFSAATAVGALLTTAAETQLTTAQVEALTTGNRNIPPCDAEAARVEDIYPLDKLVTSSESKELQMPAKDLLKAAKKPAEAERLQQEGAYPKLVLANLGRLCITNDKQGNERRARCLAYLTALLKLHSSPAVLKGNLSQITQVLGVPEGLLPHVLSKFAENQAEAGSATAMWVRPKRLVDLLVGYIIVLLLHVQGFEVDSVVLGEQLKMLQAEVVRYAKELGCKAKRIAGSVKEGRQARYAITLSVPPSFPKGPRMQKKR